MEFIDDNKEEFGVEPIVRVLKDTPARIATSSYYAYKNRPPSDRDLRDERLVVVMVDSIGRRNTLTVEVVSSGDEVLVCEDERGS